MEVKMISTALQQPVAPARRSVPGFDLVLGRHAAGSVLPRHSHDRPTICCVHSGRFTEFYGGRAVECGAELVKVTPAGDPHWNHFAGTDTVGLRVDVDRERFADLPALSRVLEERVFVRGAGFVGLAGRIIAEVRGPDDAAPVVLEGLLLELVGTLARAPGGAPAAEAPWLRQAHDMIRELYRTRLTVSDVAAAVGVHPATLARAYRRAFGCPVGEYIRRLRLERAAAELAHTPLPLSRIALDCGFYDQSHFSNAFRRQYACTPGAYRKAHGRRR
jgi:AraC family transcriptional regulator